MPAPLFDLSGRVALVTGGNKGLGKAMARGFAEAGADVFIASRHEDELKAALGEILAGTGRTGGYAVADVSNRDEVKKLARTAVGKMGHIDILVNNAGMNAPQGIECLRAHRVVASDLVKVDDLPEVIHGRPPRLLSARPVPAPDPGRAGRRGA